MHQVIDLRDKIRYSARWKREVCGHCTKWMGRENCPREKRVKGRWVGPNNETYRCSQFDMVPHCLEEWEKEVAKLKASELYIKNRDKLNIRFLIHYGFEEE